MTEQTVRLICANLRSQEAQGKITDEQCARECANAIARYRAERPMQHVPAKWAEVA